MDAIFAILILLLLAGALVSGMKQVSHSALATLETSNEFIKKQNQYYLSNKPVYE